MKDQSFSCGVRALLLPSRVSGTQDLPRARVERVVEAESRVYMVRTFSLARAYVRACMGAIRYTMSGVAAPPTLIAA